MDVDFWLLRSVPVVALVVSLRRKRQQRGSDGGAEDWNEAAPKGFEH